MADRTIGRDDHRILLVEDDLKVRQALRRALRALGHTVLEASDAEQALRALPEGRFGFVLSDVQMPGMSGLELLRRVKALAPKLPVILMSASYSSAVEALACGAFEFLPKPFFIAELERCLHRARKPSR